jgi:hypothetical protein
MISWWPGDGNPNDIQGSNNGTLQGGAGYAIGEVGQAFSFVASSNSGVIVPSTPSLNPTEAITIDAWVNPSSFPNTGPAVVRKDSNGVGTTQYSLSLGNGITAGVLSCNIGGSADATGGSVPLNQWSHVACTYDRQTIRVYVNGVEVASTLNTLAIPTSSQDLAIGKEDGFTDRNFDGLIDEVEIFDRALTVTEVQGIYNAGGAGKCRTLLGISGTVLYCSNPVPGPVPNVTLTLSGAMSGSTLSDGSGSYTFSSLLSGANYTVTPTKAARVPGSDNINTVDVIATQRHFLNLGTPLTGCLLMAADVNGDTVIDTIDVIAIQRFFLGFSTGIANTGKYKFIPVNRTYTGIVSNQTGQNYDALVFGDLASSFVERVDGANGGEVKKVTTLHR